MRRPLIVLGTSGLAREMAMLAEQINSQTHQWDILGFIGEPGCGVGENLGVAPIMGDDDWLLSRDLKADLVVGIGSPRVRARVLARYLRYSDRFEYPNLIHPKATLDFKRIKMGRGNVITAGCILTCDITIGDFNLFNLNTTIGHDAKVGNFNVLNPGVNVSGGAYISNRVLIGTGAQILENLTIGQDAVVGAGAVVTRDVLAGETVVGIPAKPLHRK